MRRPRRAVKQARADGLDRPVQEGYRRQPRKGGVPKGAGLINRSPGGRDLTLRLDVPEGGFTPLFDHGGDPARILLGQRKGLGRELVSPCRGFGLRVDQRHLSCDLPADLFASQARSIGVRARRLDPGASLAEQFERLVDRQGRFGVADAVVRTGAVNVLHVVRDGGVGQGARLVGASDGRVVSGNGLE